MDPSTFFTGAVGDALGDAFLAKQLSKEVVMVDVGTEATSALMSWNDLNSLLATRPVPDPQLRLFRQGRKVPLSSYAGVTQPGRRRREVLHPEKLYTALREGASLILDAVETLHLPVAAAAEDLVRFVREKVQVNMYATWGESQGFNTHADDHDVFIVQVIGSKHWTVHGPDRPPVIEAGATPADVSPETVAWDGVLHAGQVLHVPRGWWHTVRGRGDASVHFTFGFYRRTGRNWADWISEQLGRHEIFRQDLPRFGTTDVRQAHEAELRARLEEVLSGSSLDAFVADHEARLPRRYRFGFPYAIEFELPSDAATIELSSVLGPHIREDGDKEITVSIGGKTFTFSSGLAPMLRSLASHRRLTVGELRGASGLDAQAFAAALELLVELDVIVIDDGN